MKPWATGALTGLLVGVALAAWAGRDARFEAQARVNGGGRLIMDMRGDPGLTASLLSRVGELGRATFARRNLFLVSVYAVTMSLHPEVVPGPGRALQGVSITARLPGTITGTNAARVAGGLAEWTSLPPEGLVIRTRVVHWGRIALLGLGIVAVIFLGRRR